MSDTPDMPAAEIVPAEGIRQIGPYVERLFASKKRAAVLMLSSLRGKEALTMLRMGSGVHFHLVATWEPSALQAVAARQFFARLGVQVEEKQHDTVRLIQFSLPASQQIVTDTAAILFREVYGMSAGDGLKFRFEERDL